MATSTLQPRPILELVFSRSCSKSSLPPLRRTHSSARCRAVSNDASPQDTRPVRLRFAPSPTGSLHLGGLRTALFNHLLARKLGGKWILRIEDTDRTRLVPGAAEELLHTLQWSGLDFDEGPSIGGNCGPYVQSERRHIYDEHVKRLIQDDHAYRCFCSPQRLEALRIEARRTKSSTQYDGLCRSLSPAEVEEKMGSGETHVIRFKSRHLPEEVNDLVYGSLKLPSIQPGEDFIIVKSDGMPTYHLANVIDDHEMAISHVLRGEEWIPSTPKHLALYQAFRWTPPKFAHMPILVNPDGSKLSKRSGDVKVIDYILQGWEPEALVNWVALMGANWHNSTPTSRSEASQVMTTRDLIENFSLDRLNTHRSTMFGGKLAYLNKQHIELKYKSAKERPALIAKVRRIYEKAMPGHTANHTGQQYDDIIRLNKDRIEKLSDLPGLTSAFDKPPDYATRDAIALRAKLAKTHTTGDFHTALDEVASRLQKLPVNDIKDSHASKLLSEIQQTKSSHIDLSGSRLMTPLRYALTGLKSGPNMSNVIAMLGRDEAVRRLRHVISEDARGNR